MFLILLIAGCWVSSKNYLTIVADQVYPAMLTSFPVGDHCFMDDNTTVNQARIVQEWFTEHNSDFCHILWPPQSPDINPIAKVWDMLENIWQQSPLPSNLR